MYIYIYNFPHVLGKMGLPPNWLRALNCFYQDNTHFLQHEGSKIFIFNVQSGVRQGCPLSLVLFALALDPFIRKTLSYLTPDDKLRASADAPCRSGCLGTSAASSAGCLSSHLLYRCRR